MKTLFLILCVICGLPSCASTSSTPDPFDAALAKAMQNIAEDMKPQSSRP